MEKGIDTFQDDNSLFIHDNFYIFDCDGNKIYFGLSKNKKDKISNLYAPLQHITFTSKNLDNFVEFEIFAIIGWMGGFLSMVIMGVLTVMNKE